MFVIRCKYVQPDGVGWVTDDACVTHNPKMAVRFDSEDEAWGFLGLNYARLGSEEEAWPETAVDYSPEELAAILDDYEEHHFAYYGYI